MFSFGKARVRTLFKARGESFIFYPYGLMRKGILISPAQKEEIEKIFFKHFSTPLIYRPIRVVIIGGMLIIYLFIGLEMISDFHVPRHFGMMILLACVAVLVALATRPYRKEVARVTKGLPRSERRLKLTETIARDAHTMSGLRVLSFSLISATVAASVAFFYFRSQMRIGMVDSLIYLMLFGLFAGLSSYYAVVWVRKTVGSFGGRS